jgi:hypothetical protein
MKRLTREHMDKLLTGALSGLLLRTREAEPAAAADLIRLVAVERKIVSEKVRPPKVIWQDYLD